ncbi:MAG: undecaprenyldiphospho-muramoylpentapeptide beta-N-acetylglucosaminyltransferase [Epulopiscium sp.]|nr:undecaprenyldiphospho-muramoylpentapeptide beta-N-acetylglucosaminyltransferase [Candidatus Epulonipiscium sp.]
MKRIILTGGGTAGHVTPNIALIPHLQKEGWDIHYIGSENGIEKRLIEPLKIPYYGIASGKLRRYIDIKNFTDPFRVLKGSTEAIGLIKELKPSIVFSKGGFVSAPVVFAGWANRVPVIIHESDITPGLANKLSIPFSTQICANFPETLQHLPKNKGVLTGTPIRQELFQGDPEKGRKLCNFDNEKPVLLMMGGSQGSIKINQNLRDALSELLLHFQVVHLCGKGNLEPSLQSQKGYQQFEYLQEELPHVFALADIILSRAGANAIFELVALKKPHLLIPLSLQSSRGDQIQNAKSFQSRGYSKVLQEEELTPYRLTQEIKDLYKNRQQYIDNMKNSNLTEGIQKVMEQIRKQAKI